MLLRLTIAGAAILLATATAAAEQYLVTCHVVELAWHTDQAGSHEQSKETLMAHAREHEPSRTDVRTVESLVTIGSPFFAKSSKENQAIEIGGRLVRTGDGKLRLQIKARRSHWDPENTVAVTTSDAGQSRSAIIPRRTQLDTGVELEESNISVVSEEGLWEDEPPSVDISLAVRPTDRREGETFHYEQHGDSVVLGGFTQIRTREPEKPRGLLTNRTHARMELIETSVIIRLRKYVPVGQRSPEKQANRNVP